jgi:hypothetical protein
MGSCSCENRATAVNALDTVSCSCSYNAYHEKVASAVAEGIHVLEAVYVPEKSA